MGKKGIGELLFEVIEKISLLLLFLMLVFWIGIWVGLAITAYINEERHFHKEVVAAPFKCVIMEVEEMSRVGEKEIYEVSIWCEKRFRSRERYILCKDSALGDLEVAPHRGDTILKKANTSEVIVLRYRNNLKKEYKFYVCRGRRRWF